MHKSPSSGGSKKKSAERKKQSEHETVYPLMTEAVGVLDKNEIQMLIDNVMERYEVCHFYSIVKYRIPIIKTDPHTL